MPSTGFTICGTGSNNTDVGTEAWANPGNVTADDGSNADGNAAAKNEQMNYLVGSNFGFAIPADATIDGIEARIGDASDDQSAAGITHVIIYKNDSTPGDDLEPGGSNINSTPTNYDYGGASELWGLSWTPAEINSSNFQLRVSVDVGISPGNPNIDFLAVNVYYTEAEGGAAAQSVGKGLLASNLLTPRKLIH